MKGCNPINGKTRLTDADVVNIAKMAKAGMTAKDIRDITGWSLAVIYKCANGSYYEQRKKTREWYHEHKKIEKPERQSEEVQAVEQTVANDSAGDEESLLTFVKNINLLLYSVDKRLEGICKELGIKEV